MNSDHVKADFDTLANDIKDLMQRIGNGMVDDISFYENAIDDLVKYAGDALDRGPTVKDVFRFNIFASLAVFALCEEICGRLGLRIVLGTMLDAMKEETQ